LLEGKKKEKKKEKKRKIKKAGRGRKTETETETEKERERKDPVPKFRGLPKHARRYAAHAALISLIAIATIYNRLNAQNQRAHTRARRRMKRDRD
jgi:hypothetical protein